MGLISTTIPNLFNGVSQQPASLRLSSQCQEQINGYSSVVDGLRKRPGSRYIAKLTGVTGSAYIHTINRDQTERYIVVVQDGTLRVFDLAGKEQTVTFPNGKTYLNTANPQNAIRCVTVADYTILTNTEVTVQQGTSKTPTRTPEALVWVRQGSYAATYDIFLDDKQVAHYEASHDSAYWIGTDKIAEELRKKLVESTADYTVTRYGSTLWIRRKNGADFTIRVDDSIGDTAFKAIKGKTQRFSDLPTRAVEGFTVEIAGDNSSSYGDNHYVKYETNNSVSYGGVWTECPKGGEPDTLNPATMPHALVREANGTFTFKTLDWEPRKVGDLESNPFPSFVGRKISDVFFHRNRLGFLSDESVIFSAAADYWNFFAASATAVLDDDPIDISVSHTKVSLLRHAIAWNETLLLFSDQTQFELGRTDLLTPSSVSLNVTTEYGCSTRARPVGAGRYVYFAAAKGSFTVVREYHVDGQTEATIATDITGHVPSYIPGGVRKIAASGNEDVLVLLCDDAPNQAFVYKYYLSGTEKLQASWSRWVFGDADELLDCAFIESRLYLLIKRPDGVHLETMDLEAGATEPGWTISVHLDSRLTADQTTVSFDANRNETKLVLPYAVPDTVDVVTGPGGSHAAGLMLKPTTITTNATATTVTLDGDWRGQPLFIGRPYTFRYAFSPMLMMEDAVGGGELPVTNGRLQLRNLTLEYAQTGYFEVEITPHNRSTYRQVFSGRVINSAQNRLNHVSIEEGSFRVSARGRAHQIAIALTSRSFLPCAFMSATWEGFHHSHARRV